MVSTTPPSCFGRSWAGNMGHVTTHHCHCLGTCAPCLHCPPVTACNGLISWDVRIYPPVLGEPLLREGPKGLVGSESTRLHLIRLLMIPVRLRVGQLERSEVI